MLTATSIGRACASCGLTIPQTVLACPGCQKLVHGDELKRLVALAREHEVRGGVVESVKQALEAYHKALELLPSDSRQHAAITDKVMQLTAALEKAPSQELAKPSGLSQGKLGALGALGLLLWKFKAILLFAFTKLKFLLLGLTKAKTLFSMLLSMGVYFTLWGWKFAVGLVLSMYVHEMGHVAALRRLGVPVSAPMFVPGLGAYVRSPAYPTTPAQDARVGLAGPIWGMGAALACAAVFVTTQIPIWGALAESGAYLNLFNLVPVWQLDGARAFSAFSKRDRIVAVAAFGLAWFFTHETLLLILAAVATWRAFATAPSTAPDRRALVEYLLLIAVLSGLMHLVHLPMPKH
jgi:Zn-dependent protease